MYSQTAPHDQVTASLLDLKDDGSDVLGSEAEKAWLSCKAELADADVAAVSLLTAAGFAGSEHIGRSDGSRSVSAT